MNCILKNGRFLLPAILLLAALAETCLAAEPQVLGVLRDFERESPGPLKPIVYHNWTPEQVANANRTGGLEVVADRSFGSQCCRVSVTPDLPWGPKGKLVALNLGPDYLPPEADAVRVRVKVLRGEFHLTVGSPTVYFGHSDVSSPLQTVSAGAKGNADESGWRTLEFSLHQDLQRNFRRARFGRTSPVIYYTRWIQEPMYLYVGKGSQGELLLDQVELISRGEGRPYPTFQADELQPVGEPVDFEQPADRELAFSFLQDPIDLTRPPYLARPTWPPPKIERVADGETGKFSLAIEQHGTEEVAFAGVKLLGPPAANGLTVQLKATHPSIGPTVALDFIVYVAPSAERAAFPWERYAPPAAWQKQPEIAYTYYLSEEATPGVAYGFYHLRRSVPNGEWTTLVLPLADFICAYGQEDCQPMFQQQQLLASDTIMALGVVTPFRQRRSPTKILIDHIGFVQAPGSPAEHVSFPQTPVGK
ncbi:hypothetical protein [Lignipirellula cremea]|uniref:Carbohydrate-binding domain-containing protein n=1 Tax=Lignipirellula cremea TaxID=2528010 RepID=A0A518E1A6_9BACT|nr:hypothetical protein [Lignipirellula cremea]QDU97887.1 hypothetical protein Pla8534_57440 [Lignipirellula cremea]